MTPAEIHRGVFRINPVAWLELHGSIVSKQVGSEDSAARMSHPKANFLQRRIGEIVQWCLENDKPIRLVIVKPRQKGCSTITVEIVYVLSRLVGMNVLIVGGKEFQSNNLWNILKYYHKRDSFDWGNGFEARQEECDCTNGTKIQKLTAGGRDPGKSGTYHAVLFTELAHWPSDGTKAADDQLHSILACVPKNEPGTIAIMESTGAGPVGVFPAVYNAAVEFEDYKRGNRGNGYIRVFAPWHEFSDSVLPLTTIEREGLRKMLLQAEDEKALLLWDQLGLKPEQVNYYHNLLLDPECNGDESKRDQHYPTTPEDAFNASTPSRFALKGLNYLDQMATYAKSNSLLKWGILTMDKGADLPRIIHCTEKDPDRNIVLAPEWTPRIGQRFIIGADTCEGRANCVGDDLDSNSAVSLRTGFMKENEWWPDEPVAMLAPSSRMAEAEDDEYAEWLFWFHLLFGRAMLAPEKNRGRGLIKRLRTMGAVIIQTPRARDEIDQEAEPKLGWDTNASTKKEMISNLASRIREPRLVGAGLSIRFPTMVRQLRTFVRHPNGTEGAMKIAGCHDDEVMALAMALICRDSATLYSAPVIARNTPPEIARFESGGFGEGRREVW